ncbi:MAG: hypothetical protein WAT71_09830 [Ignavibacteria bacterium]
MNTFKKYLPDCLIFIILLIIGIKISFHSELITDIDPFDESIYLFRGITISPFIKHHLDGFFYYLWYNLISHFTADNFELFFLNNNILFVLPGLLIFLFLRIIRTDILISFISAAIYLVSSANIFVIPLITKFALCIILLGSIWIYKTKQPSDKLLIAVLLSFILIYIRPEFILSLFLNAGMYVYFIIRSYKAKPDNNCLRKFLPLILIAIIMIFFNPISRHRVNISFAQHYAKDVLERNDNSKVNIDNITRPDEIMQRDFLTDNSFSDAAINNPVLFIEHIGFNFFRSFNQIDETFPYIINENDNYTFLKNILYGLCILSLLTMCFFIVIRIKRKRFTTFSLIYISFVLPPLISVLIFYPRTHYVILIFTFILIYLSYEISSRLNAKNMYKKNSFSVTLVFGLLIIILLPFRAESGSIHLAECTRLHTAKELNKFDFNGKVNFFTVGPGIVTFLANDWKYVSDDMLELPIDEFFYKKNVNLILVNKYFFNHPLIINNKEVERILYDTSYVRFDIDGCDSYLLAKKEILN